MAKTSPPKRFTVEELLAMLDEIERSVHPWSSFREVLDVVRQKIKEEK